MSIPDSRIRQRQWGRATERAGQGRTGAGDAFIGSFARYFAAGLDLDDALAQATRYAADFGHQVAARRNPLRRKANSRRIARGSAPKQKAREARPLRHNVRFAYFRAP
jgi:hypothetical protein